jgi:23S rRNA (cytosine1962-C5)-methyltransferase
MARIFLKRGRANPLWHGHPWVYSGAVEREEGATQPGDVVDVCDAQGRFIGRGFINPRSQIRVRLLTWQDEAIDAAWLERRLHEAVRLRRRLGFPSTDTDAYRLINSEGDGLPGVAIDAYGEVAAVQFTALGMKRFEQEIFDLLAGPLGFRSVVEVSAGHFAEVEGFASATRTVRGAEVTTVPCRELGLQLEVDPLHGQKTGMFLDQRDNRRRVGELAREGARVLDLYTYAGGFALAALKGGASLATCVDTSARALERARRHAELNHLGPLELHEVDVFRFLEQVRPRSYDMVIVDPPKFARSRKDLTAALKGYERLNTLALHVCAEDALLLSCSCSQQVAGDNFEKVLAGAARSAGRRLELLELRSQGADHPIPPAFPEGRYLTAALCRVI